VEATLVQYLELNSGMFSGSTRRVSVAKCHAIWSSATPWQKQDSSKHKLERDLTVRAAEVQQQLAMACGHHWHEANEAETVTLKKRFHSPSSQCAVGSHRHTDTFRGTSVEHSPSE